MLPPEDPAADYRVRIFTPVTELPFAGHPTLGTCHAWLEGRGTAPDDASCRSARAGLVTVRRTPDGLAFAAPPLLRSGPVEEALVEQIAAVLRIDRAEIVDAQWADNGPGWIAVLLESAEAVLALTPGFIGELDIGVVGPTRRARPRRSRSARSSRRTARRSRTRSPAASTRRSRSGCSARAAPRRRTSRGRAPRSAARGRVHVTQDDDGTVWVGGGTVTCVAGEVEL